MEIPYPDLPAAVLNLLKGHKGQDNAIPSRAIARILQTDTRIVRHVIAGLVAEGHLIGATVDAQTGGFFMIESWEDLAKVRGLLKSRAAKIFERDRHLVNAWNEKHGMAIQPLLFEMAEEQ